MKNKSKLKKIKQSKNESATMPKEWLYLCENKISVSDIYDFFSEFEEYRTEIWKEAGVLEISAPEDKSIDFESADEKEFHDEVFEKLLQGQQVRAAFFVTVGLEHSEIAEKIMKQITGELSGLFCADNERLEPVISK